MKKNIYKEAIYNLPIGYAHHKIIYNSDGKAVDYIILDVNELYEKYTGLQKKDILNKKASDIFKEIQIDSVDLLSKYAEIASHNKTEEFNQYSEKLKHYYHIKAFSPEKGYFVTLLSDMVFEQGDRLQTNERYQNLFENLSSGCGVYRVINDGKFGKDYIIEAFNKKSLEMENKTAQEVVGKSLYDLRPNIDEYGLINIFREVWKTGKVINFPVKIYADENYSNYYENIVFKLEDNVIVALYNDVTDYMQIQADLENSNKQLEGYFNDAPYGIFIIDSKGNYIDVNDESCKITEYSENELLGMNLIEHIADEDKDKAQQSFLSLKNSKSVKTDLIYLTKKNDKRIWTVNARKLADNRYIIFAEDVTESRKLEDQIDYEKGRANKYLSLANILFLGLDRDGNIESINKKGCQLLGLEEKDIVGKNWFDNFLSKESIAKVKSVINDTISEKATTESFQNPIINSNGEEIMISWQNTILRDESGNITGILSSGIDVTEKIKAENKLIESEEKFKYVFNNAIIGKSLTMINGEINVNNAFCKMLGYSKEELKGIKWQTLSHPDDVESNQSRINVVIKGEKGSSNFQKRFIKKDGTILWTDVHTSLRRDLEGNPLYFMTSIIDITEQRKIMEKLNKSEKRNREWIENSPACTKILDLDFNLQYMSNAGIAGLGVKDINEYYNHPYPFDFYPESFNTLMKKNLEYSKNTRKITTQEAPVFDLNGDEIWFHSTIVPIMDEDDELDYIMVVSLDITQRKQAEKKIIIQEEEQRLILEEMQIGIIVHDKDSSILYCNKLADEIFETSREQMINRQKADKIWNFIDDNGNILSIDYYPITIILKTKKALANYIIGIKTNDTNDIKWLNINGTPIYNEKNEIERVVISFLDITESKKNTDLILQNEQRQKTMISNISDVIGVIGEDGFIKYKSNNIERIFGWKPEDLYGKIALYTVHHKDYKKIGLIYRDLLKNPNSTREVEYRYLCKDGHYKYVQLSARNMIADQNINGILVNYKDITEKKRNEKNYETMIRTTMDGFWLIDSKGYFIDANDSYCNMIGYSRKELLQMHISDIEYYEDNAEVQHRLKTIIEQGSLQFETMHVHRNKHLIDVEISTTYLEITNNFLVFIRDITDKKKAEKNEKRLEGQLRNHQKLESIGTLASGVAHEINNPINGIMNYGQMILDTNTEDLIVKKSAEEIIYETKRVATIVNNLLEFSRQNSESHSKAKIDDILERTLSLIKTVIKQDQIELVVKIEENLPEIDCRNQQIQQVLMNLFSNARDALNNKYDGYNEDKKIIIQCESVTWEEKNWVRITVEDHGNGIPKAIHDKVFDPFFTTKDRSKGTGLGLSISYGIIQEHGGELSFEVNEGKSTKFIVYLPI